MVLRVILAPARPHVAVDRVKTLRDGAPRTVDIGLFGDDNLFVLPPKPCFPGGSTSAETSANDQNVDIVFNYSFAGHQ